ncbi:MAG TPA: class I SAM-dependent methyltransferase [Candidatus Thermoplasmatota archaeon]
MAHAVHAPTRPPVERPPEPRHGRRGLSPAFERLVRSHDWEGRAALDVGCGTGAATLLLARLGARATGVDIDPTVLRMARARAREDGLRRARFVAADAERAGYRRLNGGPPLDGVVAHLCFSERIARAAFRGLRPGGVFIVRSFHADMWREAGAVAHFALSGRQMRSSLREIGFRVGSLTTERRSQSFRSYAHFERSFLANPERRAAWQQDGRLARMERHLGDRGGALSEAFLVVEARRPAAVR